MQSIVMPAIFEAAPGLGRSSKCSKKEAGSPPALRSPPGGRAVANQSARPFADIGYDPKKLAKFNPNNLARSNQ